MPCLISSHSCCWPVDSSRWNRNRTGKESQRPSDSDSLPGVTEFDLIAAIRPLLTSQPHVIVGVGDDCAVLESGPDSDLLLKTDAVVEGIHFLPGTDPERVGHKALARPLSDIAAMGGTPTAALVTLGLPRGFDPDRVLALYRGMNRLAARHQLAVVGGETTTNPGQWLVSVTVVGFVPRGQALLRSGARVGDALFVSGELGGSIEGHHLDFEPRLAQGRWLRSCGWVHSLMDISDGLAGDLPHMLAASGGHGAELLASAIPIRRAARVQALDAQAKPPLLAALTDGEDFELLWTCAPKDAVRLLDGWKSSFPDVGIHCIGRVMEQPGVRIRDSRGIQQLPPRAYEHFSSHV